MAKAKKKSKAEEVEEEVRPKKTKSTRTKSGPTTMVVDWSKDKSEGGRKRFKEDDYKFKIVSVSTGRSKDKETPFVQLNLQFMEGKYKGEKISDRCYLTDAALWRLRSVYEALGKSVPKKKTKMDFTKLIGGVLGASVADDNYESNGKTRTTSRIADYFDLDALSEEEDDDDEDDEDEDDEDDDALEDMDVDEDL